MRARVPLLALAVLFALTLASPAPVAAFCEIQEPPTPVPTQVNGTQVEIFLTEGFARVVIIKEFYNPSEQFKEGQVFFPLEKGHELITDLRLKIGNVVYNSSAQDRGEALDEFLENVQAGQDAALVQYDPPRDVYWIAVTIPPKQARTTITTLEMPLAEQDGFYGYDYRLSVDARDSVSYLRAHVRIETTDPLVDVRIPTNPSLPIVRSGDRVAEAWVNSTEEARRSDLRVLFRADGPAVSQLALPDGTRYLRYTIDAADEAFAGTLQRRPRAFLILVDASGSMGRFDRWTLAADSTAALVNSLIPGESYGLATFHGRTVSRFSDALSPAGDGAESSVRGFLASADRRGSTNLAVVLDTAKAWASQARSRGQQPLLFLVTDGRTTVGPQALDLEKAFREVSYDEDLVMSGLVVRATDRGDEVVVRNLTHLNHGGFHPVYGDYAPTAVADVLAEIHLPVLHDVRVSFAGGGTVDLATRDPQKVLEGGELLVLARTRGTANDSVGMRIAWSGPDGVERSFPVTYGGSGIPTQPLLHRQWVLTRIHTLLDRVRGGEDPVAVEEIEALGTANRVVTPYTSLLVTIPRESPDSGSSEFTEDFLADFGLGGSQGLAGGSIRPGSVESDSSRIFTPRSLTPLSAEARLWDSWRRDQNAPLLIDDEVDRWISTDDRDAASAFRQEASRNGFRVAFQGNFVTVFEASGELVGLRDPFVDSASVGGRTAASVTWAGFAAIVLAGFVHVHREARRFRRETENAEEDPSP